MSEQVLDLQAVLSILRRRRRWIVAAGILGAVAGVALVLTRPPMYSSSTLVLLPAQSVGGAATGRDMGTETRIAMSDAVLGRARTKVRPVLTRREVQGLVAVDSPSSDMLHIVASGRTREAAESLAHAVAAAEIAYEQTASSSMSNAARAALDQRHATLASQLAGVNQEIAATKGRLEAPSQTPAQTRADRTALAQLTAQQSALALDIDAIESQLAQQTTGPGAQLVQDATPATRPRPIVWLILALVLGTTLGLGTASSVVVAVARRDPRLRTRDELADALGSPVLGSVKSHRVRTTAAWSQLLESYRPTAVDAWSLRQVLDRVGVGPLLGAVGPRRGNQPRMRLTVVVVVPADDPAALAVAGQLASHTASLGVRTHLTARQRHAAADALWATSAKGDELRPGLRVDPKRGNPRRQAPADLVLELAVVERQQPVFPDLHRADAIVLVVSSGLATEEDLARVAVAAYEAGGRFRGIVVADPDSLDHTTGRLLQAERAIEPPLPMKLTGLDPEEWSDRDEGQS